MYYRLVRKQVLLQRPGPRFPMTNIIDQNGQRRYEDNIITILLRLSKFFSGQVCSFFINKSFLIAKYSEDNLKLTFIFYLSFKEY